MVLAPCKWWCCVFSDCAINLLLYVFGFCFMLFLKRYLFLFINLQFRGWQLICFSFLFTRARRQWKISNLINNFMAWTFVIPYYTFEFFWAAARGSSQNSDCSIDEAIFRDSVRFRGIEEDRNFDVSSMFCPLERESKACLIVVGLQVCLIYGLKHSFPCRCRVKKMFFKKWRTEKNLNLKIGKNEVFLLLFGVILVPNKFDLCFIINRFSVFLEFCRKEFWDF